jgi:hypothetical protein
MRSAAEEYDPAVPYRLLPAPPPKIPDGPDHIGAAQRIARRNRRIGLVLLLAVGVSAGISALIHRADRARHRAAFEEAKLDLEACLLGPEPLAVQGRPVDACTLRVRRRQLVAMTTPVERRIDEALHGWPMRCGEPAKRMASEGVELDDARMQYEAKDALRQLVTMKASSAPIELPLCSEAPHLAKASGADAWPSLAAPLDLDALVAHGPPAHAAKRVKDLDLSGDDDPKLPEGESLSTDADWPGVIHAVICQSGRCPKRIVARETFDLNDPELRASDAERFHATRVGASILAVWRGGTRGGLRMRVAPIDRLAATRDIVVFDDLVRQASMSTSSTLEAFRVHGGAHGARIFLVTERGTWVVTVDESGAFALR